jgi:hypothetical protein
MGNLKEKLNEHDEREQQRVQDILDTIKQKGENMKQTLTAQEMQMIAQVIDMASRKGLFGAADMMAIGALHTKLAQMIQQEMPKAPESPETPKEPYIKD